MPDIAKVIVDIAHSNVDRIYTYIVPDGLEGACPGMRVSVPFGRKTSEGYIVSVGGKTDIAPEKLKPINSMLDDIPAILPEMLSLAEYIKQRYHCTHAEALRLMIPAEMRGGRVHEKTERAFRLLLTAKGASVAAEKLKPNAVAQRALLELLAREPLLPVSRAAGEVKGYASAAKALEEKGFIEITEISSYRKPYSGLMNGGTDAVRPNDMQKAAYTRIISAMESGGGRFLLHGITGSGKTEVYFRVIQQAIEAGRGAILLLPEIALTPQMVQRFRDRFGAAAAVLHSRLSPGEKYDEWMRLRRGEALVAIGARSAVFAPVEKPAVIIVDEEHEHTYVSEHSPSYDAVEVAGQRASHGAVLIIGSATPSVKRYYEALGGAYEIISLPKRATGQELPPVEIVDMRKELSQGNSSVFSGKLHKALLDTIAAGDQAMILMNRRGYTTHVSCRDCGEVIKCPNCDIAMTYHITTGRLLCHYCGHEEQPPTVCPSCGSRRIRHFGAGTQRVEKELAEYFSGVSVLRMDADTTRGKDAHAKILEEFRQGRAQILLGTQMISKGLDFPGVTLTGILAADTALNLPDYQSTERAFQLIAQMAGRAGRSRPGRVIVQTYLPDHPAVRFAAAHDYHGFYEWEIERRREGEYPPFARFLRYLASDKDADSSMRIASELHERLTAWAAKSPLWQRLGIVMMCSSAPIGMIRGLYRSQVLIKVRTGEGTDELMEQLHSQAKDLLSSKLREELDPTGIY